MNKIHSIRESFSVGGAEGEESNGIKLANKNQINGRIFEENSQE
jgi:hypothetical protein